MNEPIRIVQFSDTHFFSQPDGVLCGINTTQSLMAVIQEAQKKCWPPDLILATGDLSQDETVSSYERLFNIFETLGAPVYCLPGNHDDISLMLQYLNKGSLHTSKAISVRGWQIILLNSQVPKKNHGHLSAEELIFLREALEKSPHQPTMVCLHHHPLPSGTPWMDTMILDNTHELFDILNKQANVKLLVHGHTHQSLEKERNNISVLGAPSTCIQFTPKSCQFQLDSLAPGYRWIDLKSDGTFETGVIRTSGFNFQIDIKARGY